MEGGAIIVALYFIATSNQPISLAIAIFCLCAITFLSIPISTRVFIGFVVSKSVIFLSCIVYIIFLESDSANNTGLIFPLIITFVMIFSLAYWLYLRQVKWLYQKYEQE